MLGELAQGKLGCGVTQPTLSFIAHVCEKRFGKHGISLQVLSTRRNVSQVLESRGNLRTLNTSSQSRPRKRAVAVGRHGRQQSFEIQLPFLHSSCPKFAAVTSQRWTEIANCKCKRIAINASLMLSLKCHRRKEEEDVVIWTGRPCNARAQCNFCAQRFMLIKKGSASGVRATETGHARLHLCTDIPKEVLLCCVNQELTARGVQALSITRLFTHLFILCWPKNVIKGCVRLTQPLTSFFWPTEKTLLLNKDTTLPLVSMVQSGPSKANGKIVSGLTYISFSGDFRVARVAHLRLIRPYNDRSPRPWSRCLRSSRSDREVNTLTHPISVQGGGGGSGG